MNKILLFAGTSEGRELSEELCKEKIPHTVCVATEYGSQIMEQQLSDSSSACMTLHEGRMDAAEMENFIKTRRFETIVDATHPYAVEASSNIRKAADACGLPYLRLMRAVSVPEDEQDIPADIRPFSNPADCAAFLETTDGNILLTTGSKDLAVYMAHPRLKDRLYVRVLPGKESIAICETLSIPGKQIIAMQGPFSAEMNIALIHQFQIRWIVSKESGRAGGYPEKLEACEKTQTPLCLIQKKEETCTVQTYSLPEIKNLLMRKFAPRKVSLVGCGMGNYNGLTLAAEQAIRSADLVFGASRLLADMKDLIAPGVAVYPYYLGKDILAALNASDTWHHAVVLFSGDTGFYSGARKLSAQLQEMSSIDVQILPGISSPAALAAAFGINWDDCRLISIHGKGDSRNWASLLLDSVRYYPATFLLVSGVSDLHTIAKLLLTHDLSHCRILAGYQLGHKQEKLYRLTPAECEQVNAEGLYSLFIQNTNAQERFLTHGLPDSAFQRGKVPMTKEEVRTISISRLGLTEHAIVYDIGSGTGSVSIEIARLSASIKVYAVERKPEALELMELNRQAFGLENLYAIAATAPAGLEELPAPTHAFLGGTGGNMKEIVRFLLARNPSIRIVANAVSFETLQELLSLEQEFPICDFSISSLAATRTKKVAGYHMMQAENPIWICSFRGC